MRRMLICGRFTLFALTVASIPISGALAAGSSVPSYQTGIKGGFGVPHQTVNSARGPLIVTGNLGNMQTTTLPGAGGQGLLVNNGNGTSTLIGQGGMVTTVPTPR